MRTLSVVVIYLFLIGCTQKEHTKELLESSGYTEVSANGYSFFGCSEDDVFRTKFSAKTINGRYVEGVVCSGWFKGSTIRFY